MGAVQRLNGHEADPKYKCGRPLGVFRHRQNQKRKKVRGHVVAVEQGGALPSGRIQGVSICLRPALPACGRIRAGLVTVQPLDRPPRVAG